MGFDSKPSAKLARTVLDVLQHPGIKAINFCLNDKLTVTGTRFGVVRKKILEGRITCTVGVSQVGVLEGSVARAQYVPGEGTADKLAPNQFRFPHENYGTDFGHEKVTIVHEATHAIFDVFMPGDSALAIDNEAAAFLAAALFVRNSQYSFGGGLLIGGPEEEALHLADRMMTDMERFDYSGTYMLWPSDLSRLRNAVAQEYGLTGGKATIVDLFDGV